jgi:ABC-type multidrug transport system, ATPase and permease components
LLKEINFLEIYNNKVKDFETINLQFENFDNFLIFLLASLFLIFFIKAIYSFICFKYEIKFQQKLATLLSTQLFGTYLNLDFEKINLRQKNELVRNLSSEINRYVKFYIQPLYLIINEFCKIIGISILLFVYDTYIFLIGFSTLIIIYLVFKIFFAKKTNEIGEQRLNYSSLLLKYIQEGIDSLKEIKLTRNKNYFKNLFNNILIKNAKIIL